MKPFVSWWLRLCLMAWLCLPALALGQVVGSLSTTRGGLSALAADSNFQSLVRTTLPAATFTTSDTLTPGYLKDVDVLVLGVLYDGWGVNIQLTTSEIYAVRDFVMRGKGVVIFGENSSYNPGNQTMIGPFGAYVVSGHTVESVPILNPSNPVTGAGETEPASTVDVAWAGGLGYDSNSIPLANYGDGSAAGVYIPEDRLGPGSGRVVMFGDALFLNDTENNRRVMSRSVRYAYTVPEPPAEGTVRVGAWDVLRGGQAAVFQSPTFRDAVKAAYAPRPVQFVSFNALNQDVLDRTDVLILSSVYNGSGNALLSVPGLSSDEQATLLAARDQGKGILIATDNDSFYWSNQSMLNPFGAASVSNYVDVFWFNIPDPKGNPFTNNPATNDPLPVPTWFSGYTAWFSQLPGNAIPLGYLPNGGIGMAYIPGTSTQGPVGLFTDISVLYLGEPTNARMFRNIMLALAPQTRDTTPPTTTFTTSYSGTSRYIALSAADAGLGVWKTFYRIDGGADTEYAAPFAIPTSETHTVTYWSVDVARNVETPANTYLFDTAKLATLTVTMPGGTVGVASTATVTLKSPTNTAISGQKVQLMVDGAFVREVTTGSSGKASASLVLPDPAGAHTISASFAGNSSYLPITASNTFTVSPDDVQILPTAVSGTVGKNVTLRAKMVGASGNRPVANRDLLFFVNGVQVGNGPFRTNSSGVAVTGSYKLGDPGTYTLTAAFAGDATFRAGSGSSTIAVSQSATALTVTNVSQVAGRYATISARLRRSSDNGNIVGASVELALNGTSLGSFTTDATGYVRTIYLIPAGTPPGTQTITATYGGSTSYLSSSGAGSLTIR